MFIYKHKSTADLKNFLAIQKANPSPKPSPKPKTSITTTKRSDFLTSSVKEATPLLDYVFDSIDMVQNNTDSVAYILKLIFVPLYESFLKDRRIWYFVETERQSRNWELKLYSRFYAVIEDSNDLCSMLAYFEDDYISNINNNNGILDRDLDIKNINTGFKHFFKSVIKFHTANFNASDQGKIENDVGQYIQPIITQYSFYVDYMSALNEEIKDVNIESKFKVYHTAIGNIYQKLTPISDSDHRYCVLMTPFVDILRNINEIGDEPEDICPFAIPFYFPELEEVVFVQLNEEKSIETVFQIGLSFYSELKFQKFKSIQEKGNPLFNFIGFHDHRMFGPVKTKKSTLIEIPVILSLAGFKEDYFAQLGAAIAQFSPRKISKLDELARVFAE